MRQLPDRKKLRRDYLRSRTNRRVASGTASGVFVLMLIAMIFFLLLTISCAIEAWQSGRVSFGWLWCGIYAVLTMTSGRIAYRSCFWREEAERAARRPFVAPFNVDTLPADEILVRGAGVSLIAKSEGLLRAAKGGETPTEELLRGETGP